MKVGLFFGSFNPIHNGHLAIAKFMKEKIMFDQIWIIVSPANPLKDKNILIPENDRLNMVQLAIQDYVYLRVCDIEFLLPRPSYTINTLSHLKNQYKNYEFALILGDDNMGNFCKWKEYEKILEQHIIYVYPRTHKAFKHNFTHPHVVYVEAPILPISSTKIRFLCQQGLSVAKYVPLPVIQYMKDNKLYLSSLIE